MKIQLFNCIFLLTIVEITFAVDIAKSETYRIDGVKANSVFNLTYNFTFFSNRSGLVFIDASFPNLNQLSDDSEIIVYLEPGTWYSFSVPTDKKPGLWRYEVTARTFINYIYMNVTNVKGGRAN